jgi:NADH dehydrogenase
MKKRQIVILGGGFAGLSLINSLDKRRFSVTLVDRNNYHQFQPLLYQVASSGLEAGSICFPFRKLFAKRTGFTFRLAEVISVNRSKRLVHTSTGDILYDYLVIATGTTTNFFGNDTLADEVLSMKTVEEAMLVRNRILMNLEKATLARGNERAKLLNLVVVGGGATGVEVAGMLSEMKRYVIPRDFPELSRENLNIYLIEGGPRVLGALSEKSSNAALSFLVKMGVTVMLGKMVTDYKDSEIILNDGSAIPANVVLWVSGVCGKMLDDIPAESYGRGIRIKVDLFNRINGSENVFAIGDIALMKCDKYPSGHPQVAQAAIQQAVNLGKNLFALERNKKMKPFRYKDLGSLATIGRNRAVADLGRMHLRGFPAWAIWMFVHLRSILGVRNKIAVLIDWIWNYFSYHHSVRLIIFKGKRV